VAWTDAELVQQARKGNREAFGRLVERHRRTVFALALQRGFQPAEAEDIAQESFIKAYTGLHTLSAPEAFERWLYGIAGHVMADAARARKRRTVEQSGQFGTTSFAAEPPAADRVPQSVNEEAESVLRALQGLTEEQRLVITLRYMQGLSPKQIAERLGEPRGTIRSRLHHALAYLQTAFGAQGSRSDESARTQKALNGEEGRE